MPTAGSVQLNRTDGDEQTHLDERGFSAAVAADDADATVEVDAKVNLKKKPVGGGDAFAAMRALIVFEKSSQAAAVN